MGGSRFLPGSSNIFWQMLDGPTCRGNRINGPRGLVFTLASWHDGH